jgi:hypothetical protein
MFGKKKPTPPPLRFTLEVLTHEYLIDGQAEGDDKLFIPNSEKHWGPIELTSVGIKATGQPGVPPRTAARFAVQGEGVVAIIPRHDVTGMAQYYLWKEYKHRREGLFHIGPYQILGAMMFNGDTLFGATMPMVDVTIRHCLPNAALEQLSAPFILVNTKWFSGYEPA